MESAKEINNTSATSLKNCKMLRVVLPVFNLVFPQYLRLSNLNLWQMDKQQMAVRKKEANYKVQ